MKRGRPYDKKARGIVLDMIRSFPGISYYALWKKVRATGISKGLFHLILGEMDKKGRICRKETKRITKTVTFHIRNLNDLSIKTRTARGEGDSSC